MNPYDPYSAMFQQLAQQQQTLTAMLQQQGGSLQELRQITALLREQNAPARRDAPIEIGNGYSGISDEIGNPILNGDHTQPVGVIKINFPQRRDAGALGLASVQVESYDVTPLFQGEQAANAVLVGDLSWNSGRGGVGGVGKEGNCVIDLTRGTCFTVGMSNSLELRARFAPAVFDPDALDQQVRPWATKKVEVTVSWQGSINPKAVKSCLPGVVLRQPNTPSAFLKIPVQAESMIAFTTDPASLAALSAEFSTSNVGTGASIRHRTIDPFTNGTPIADGFEFVRFVTTSATLQTITPCFELWI